MVWVWCGVEVLDFGDAAPVPPEGLIEYKGSSGYRAPEMTNFKRYRFPVDIFSLGVLSGELLQEDSRRKQPSSAEDTNAPHMRTDAGRTQMPHNTA